MSPRGGRDPGGGDLTGRQPNAVLSAFAVLEEVARVGPGVTAREVSVNLGMPRATTYRLLNLLVQDEYLVRLPDLAGFALGHKVALLAGMSTQREHEREAHRIVEDLRGRIRGGVHLAAYRAGAIELLDVDPDFPLSDRTRILHDHRASALGRLLLAETDLRPGAPPVPYAVQVDVLVAGHGCLAVPVRDDRGLLVGALAVAVPSPRLEDPAALHAVLARDCVRLAEVLAPAAD